MANWRARLADLLKTSGTATDIWKHCGPTSNDIWTALRVEINDQTSRAWLDQKIALKRLSETAVDEITTAVRQASEQSIPGGLKAVSESCRKVADQLTGSDEDHANSLPILITAAYVDLASMRAASSPDAEVEQRIQDYRTRVRKAYLAWCRWRITKITTRDWIEGFLFKDSHASVHDQIAGHNREWWVGFNSVKAYMLPLAELAKRRFFNDSQRVAMECVSLSFGWNSFASAEPGEYIADPEMGHLIFGPYSFYLENNSVSKSEPYPRKVETDVPGIIEDIDLGDGKRISFLQANYKGAAGKPIAGKSIGNKPGNFVTYEPTGLITTVETRWNRKDRVLAGITFYCGRNRSVPYGNSDNAPIEPEKSQFDGFHLSSIGGAANYASIFALELGFRHDSLAPKD